MSRFLFILSITLRIFLQSFLSQENIVPNGSFDEEEKCAVGPSTLAHWFVPNATPIDVNKLCPYIDWWRFIRDKKQGFQGTQCGYLETYYKGFADDNIYAGRLYLAVKLSRPLIAGKQYYFEMKVKAVDTFPNFKLVNTVFTNGQDVAFTKDQPTFDFDIPRNFFQIKPTIVTSLHKGYDWRTVSACFKAEGHEKYMIIGNFRRDVDTDFTPTGKRNLNFPNGLIANYAIDDVILTETDFDFRDTAICEGQKLELEIKKTLPSDLKYLWSDGQTANKWSTSVSGLHSIKYIYNLACSITDEFALNVLPKNFSSSKKVLEICPGEEILLSARIGSPNEKIKWSTGDESESIVVTRPAKYFAQNSNTCTSFKQEYEIKEGVCEDGIFIPNIFAPHSNEDFKPLFKSNYPTISNYRMTIFDRWGNIVFSSDKPHRGWDGRYKNHDFKQGVYLYYITYTLLSNDSEKVQRYKGDITLINNGK